ncbi:MAG: NADH-quinone oxidoreductase subunit N [Candidatus Thermoplasmatota archaeon]
MAETRNSRRTFGTVILLALVALIGYALYAGWGGELVAVLLPDLEWQSMTPELVVLLFAVLAPIVGLFDSDRRGLRQFALIGLGGAFLLSLGSLLEWHLSIPGTGYNFTLQYQGSNLHGAFVVTYASQFLKVLFTATAFLAVLGVGRPLKGRSEEDFGEFCSLLLFATLGMMIVASAQELLTLLLGIEMTSMSSYLLAAMRRDRVAAEASLKYFTIGAISSGLLIFGISLLYGMAGTTRIPELATALTAGGAFDAVSLVPIAFILAGLGFKISSVPFHAWAPDVYAGAPTPVAGLLASGSKAMGFAALFNLFLVGLVGLKTNWQLLVAVLAAASMVVGNLVALQQTSIRRMLAFSSIAQAGYVLIALAVGTSAQDGGIYAVGGGLFHLVINAAMKLGAFLIVGGLLTAGIGDQIADWRGLGRRHPVLAFSMALFLLSMAGLPPLAGFASKFVLFSSAVDVAATQGLGWLGWLAVLAIANSALSLFVYLRVLRTMYVEEGEQGRLVIPGSITTAVVVCAAFVLFVGLWPQPILDASFKAAASLLGL